MVSVETYTLMDYVTQNYVTLLVLAAMATLLAVNHKMQIQGRHYMWCIIGIVFGITLLEALEDICDIYHLSVRILYIKTACIYWIYPLIALLELFMIVPIQRKVLTCIPYCINFILVTADLFGTGIIYGFEADHSFTGGPCRMLPILVLCFYVLLLGIHSVLILQSGYRSKGVIALFMAGTSILTAIGEEVGFARGTGETVTAVEMVIYYFFLSAINYSKAQETLNNSRLELERQRLRLLVVQMQPHFIFNALATIQSLCYTDSEAAADCIDVFGDYLRANISSLSSDEPISFTAELAHSEQYIQLEKASTDVNFNVIYDLRVQDFKIPPLTIQPIVENAIKHGALTRRDGTGFVKIKTEEQDGWIIITVTDNGTGAALTPKQKEHQSVGIENVRQRLEIQCGGKLSMQLSDKGASTVISIPKHFRI